MNNKKELATPIFRINLDRISQNYHMLSDSFKLASINYSYKTNPHNDIATLITSIGGKITISSHHELRRISLSNILPSDLIYHSIANTENELNEIINYGVGNIIVNSINELTTISNLIFKSKKNISIGIRINSNELLYGNIGNSKFGLSVSEFNIAKKICSKNSFLKLCMLATHIGTNQFDPKDYRKVYSKLRDVGDSETIIINIGGGFPSNSNLTKNGLTLDDYSAELVNDGCDFETLSIEPGRCLVEDACECISTVVGKVRNNIILNISSNFIPPLANADYHIQTPTGKNKYNFCGRLCFGADIIANDVLSKSLDIGDTIIVGNAGAYTYGMRGVMGYDDPTIIVTP